MSIPDNLSVFIKLIKLLKEYKDVKLKTPGEFIDEKIGDENVDENLEAVYDGFITIEKHDKFFNQMVQNFWNYYQLKPFNKEIIETIMYVIIFELTDAKCRNFTEILMKLNFKFSINVIEYFTVENNLVDIVQAGCKFYENDYVLSIILHPILKKHKAINELYRTVEEKFVLKTQILKKPLTIPNGPACSNRIKHLSKVPNNTPTNEKVVIRKSLRKSVIEGDRKFQATLDKAHEENKERALKLLEFARTNAFKCATVVPKIEQAEEHDSVKKKFVRSKIPVVKNVTIKRNTATLMREAAILAKDKEIEIRNIEYIIQTSFDPAVLEELENDIRKCKEQQNIQDIERKHLQGQLTYEEAIIAKQNLLKLNQDKMEEFKLERIAILEEIDLWRRKEQEKMRALVEKCQGIEKAARDAGKKMHEDKRKRAKLVDEETKQLLNDAYIKEQEEFARKVKLIQELRALQQVRSLQAKEFDPTESSNMGLLCEMSIAELQERLFLLKLEMKEELERKQKIISDGRIKQQQLMENVKQFIDQSRVAKPKPVPRSNPKVEQTPEIITLRERLQQARQTRISFQQASMV